MFCGSGHMATEYYLKRAGQEAGPFGFRDLVVLAREGKLAESDLVRYSWTNEWKRADSVVALFHMARRAPDVVARAEPSPVQNVPDESVNPSRPKTEIALSDIDNRPGWMKRLLFIGGRNRKQSEVPILGPPAPVSAPPQENRPLEKEYRVRSFPRNADNSACGEATVPVFQSPPASIDDTNPRPVVSQLQEHVSEAAGTVEPGTEISPNLWSSTVDEALTSVTARQSGNRRNLPIGRRRKLFHRLSKFVPGNWHGDGWLRLGYRVVCALVVAATVAVSVASWSEEEGDRFLRGASQKATVRLFPVVGKCSPGKYWFLMTDLVLATAAVTWFAAGWLESHAE